MLAEPNCFKKKCKYFLGVIQPDGSELSEVNNCEAFPSGIPNEIAYGKNKHNKPLEGQHNQIVFEKEK